MATARLPHHGDDDDDGARAGRLEVTLTLAPPAAEAYWARVDFLSGLWTVPVTCARAARCGRSRRRRPAARRARRARSAGARQVTLVNRSRRAVDVSFADAADALAAKAVGSASPAGRPRPRRRVGRATRARTAPRRRRGSGHSAPIVLIVDGGRPLLQLAGACGDGVALEMDQLSFGQAALNTR